ncbi:hypothetical protein Acr_24g0009100 [Actinidia rufa]|uniref:CCHC-type domain-containing protein n=1 Tax=Actinidia rufa TaxID=165716 RepID=A0A7J0GV46_9ERIC|nr:hypothetical protein Acr_24g0009100 [Actinidia rufa]
MRKLREKPSRGVSSVSFNRRLSKYCAICSKQSLPFCLESLVMVSVDNTRGAKSVIIVAMIAVRFILIGPQSMRMRAVKMKPMPMKFFGGGHDQGGRGQRGRGQGNHGQGGRMFGNFESRDYRMKMDLPSFNGNIKSVGRGFKPVRPIRRSFYRLSARNNLPESEDQQIARFVNGLRVAIRDQVSLQTLYSLNEAVTLAKKVESQQNRTNIRSQFSNRGKQPVPSPQSQLVTNSGSQTKAVTTGSTTHQGGNPNPYAKASGDKCYRCGEPGHRSNTCPKRATVNLVEPVPEEEDGGDDEGDVDPYSYDPNEFQDDEEGEYLGRSLVIQKLLLIPKRVDSSQRHKIFRGQCTINKREGRSRSAQGE